MSNQVFMLPDLGEGLAEADIAEWHVKVGDVVTIDQIVVEVETAKAAVDVPIPFAGTVVELHGKDGDTLRTQMNAAMSSAPDAIGIISWNEFSENSHIEPSQTHGDRYLQVLSEINNLPPPMIAISSSDINAFPSF